MKVEIVKKIIEEARTKSVEWESFVSAIHSADSAEDKAVDIQLVKAFENIERVGYFVPRRTDGSWRWEWRLISQGEYPLEKLPDHVRDLAYVLYYQKSKKSA
jgi:hypothetical protein